MVADWLSLGLRALSDSRGGTAGWTAAETRNLQGAANERKIVISMFVFKTEKQPIQGKSREEDLARGRKLIKHGTARLLEA